MNQERTKGDLVFNFLELRKSIGLLGVVLPFVLASGTFLFDGCAEILDSISAYYHTCMRNVFVGVLCAIAVFFISYKGYNRQDYWANKLAGLFALGIALSPTATAVKLKNLPPENIKEAFMACEMPEINSSIWVDRFHLIFAALFFLTLIYITWFLFTKTDQLHMSEEKRKRNMVYRCSAITMLSCLVLIAIYLLWLKFKYPTLDEMDPIFWLESIALVAFGSAWLTKGEMILADNKPEMT